MSESCSGHPIKPWGQRYNRDALRQNDRLAMMRLVLMCMVSGVLAAPIAHAQPYPSRAIRIIVPFVAGGSTDVFARMVSQHLTEAWKQPVLVDNRPGAASNIGTELAARAAPDGYTLLMGSPGMVTNPSLYKNVGFDPLKDFTAVVYVSLAPLVVSVHPSLPAKTLAELVALARREPGKLNFASAGSSTHLATELLKFRAKIDLVHVPYKGNAPATTDLVAGQVHMMLNNVQASLPHLRTKRVRGLAVTSLKRVSQAPELPTVADSGYPGFQAASWFGLVAPAGTPPALVEQLNREVNKLLATQSARERIVTLGAEPVGGSVQAFQQFIEQETATWSKLIKTIGLREQ